MSVDSDMVSLTCLIPQTLITRLRRPQIARLRCRFGVPAVMLLGMTLARIARRQGGVFTRRQALQAGVSAEEIQRQLLTGAWISVMDDVLMAATTPVTPATHAWTGVLALGQPVALSGRFAALFAGLERAPGYVRPEFVIPDNRFRRELPGITVHRVQRKRWSTIWRHGLPLVPVPVMIRQLAADAPYDVARDVVQHALRRRQVTQDRLLAQLGRGLSGAAALRRILEEVAPGYQVMWERRFHRELLDAGVRLQPQTRVVAPDGRVAYLDLGDEELKFGVEIDGFLNHMARFAADRRRRAA
jgi:hypothetical protein